MSDTTQQALNTVKREEENNAIDTSNQADQAAQSGNYDDANRAANESEQHATNASNLDEVTGGD